MGPDDPKFQVEGSPPPNILFLRKLGKLSFVSYKNLDGFFFHFVTIHAFDGGDRRTALHSMQHGKNKNTGALISVKKLV